MMKKLNWLIGICIALAACHETKSDQIHMLDLRGYKQEQKLKWSDLCNDIHVISLETTPEALLPGYFKYWLGEKYCVVVTDEAILQFSPTGKFVRVLAVKGRGPGEFDQVTAFTVNETTGHLYFTNYSQPDCINKLDLNTGRRLEDIPMKNANASYLYMPSDEILCGIGLEMTYTPYFYYKVSTSGVVQDTVLKNEKLRGSTMMGTRTPYVHVTGGEVHIKNSYLDTLFIAREGKLMPWCAWKSGKTEKEDEHNFKAESIDVLWETDDLLFLERNKQKIEHKDNSVIFYTQEDADFVIDKKKFQVRRLSELYIDPLGKSREFCPKFKVCGRTVSFVLPALVFLNDYANQPEQLAPELRALAEHLSEDSNPLLIVGTMK